MKKNKKPKKQRRKISKTITRETQVKIDALVRQKMFDELGSMLDQRLGGLSSAVVGAMNQSATSLDNCNRVLMWAEAALRESKDLRDRIKKILGE